MKKILSITILFMLITNSVFGFTYPEPDWGKLLEEKTSMVTEKYLELYTEGSIESAPYFGAKFEPRAGAYIGMIAESSGQFRPVGSYLTYIEDMGQDDLYYPANQMIESDDVISVIGWTIHDINNVNYTQIRKVLDRLNTYRKPMLIRFANEMNVSALGNDPEKYKQVFRIVADMIHEYPNFGVVWSPNDIGGLDRSFDYFYPGDEYVDWIGVSSYMKKYFQGKQTTDYKDSVYFMTGDFAWATNSIKPIIEFMQENDINKPVMLSECGVATNNNFGEDMEDWATPRLRNMLYYLVMKYPQIKMINYFNTYRAYEVEKYDISEYNYAVDIFNEARNSGAYIIKYGALPKFVYQPANRGEILTANNGVVNLYTLAHFPGYPDVTVNYILDGIWYSMSSKIPYKCALDITRLSDGAHTINISAYDNVNTYTFYKKGQNISFGNNFIKDYQGSDDVTVTLNGNKISFDEPPFIENGRTLVPLRAIFEALKAKVDWQGETQTITATKGELKIVLRINSDKMYVGNQVKVIDVPAKLVGTRTFVPARAVSEAFGCDVDWDGNTQTVIITQ